MVIWRLAQRTGDRVRRHGGLTAKCKGARAGFLRDPTHLAALAACIQAMLTNSNILLLLFAFFCPRGALTALGEEQLIGVDRKRVAGVMSTKT